MYLDLRSPLFYKKINKIPVKIRANDEFLAFYELDPVQSRSIEPARGSFPGKLTFTAQKIDDSDNLPEADKAALPAGKYLFTQRRNKPAVLKTEELADMAVEQQKDGLWERNKLTNQLYVRYLYEDGSFVTQLFRPIAG